MIAADQATIKNDTLLCPNCGGEYLHHERVDVSCRFREDGDGFTASIEGKKITTSFRPAEQLPGRRDSIAVDFYCEACDSSLTLLIKQHKGNTLLEWFVDTETPSRYKKRYTGGADE